MKKLSQLILQIKAGFRTATLKDSGVVFVGNMVSSVLGAVFFFFLAHRSGPWLFGVFSVVMAVAMTTTDLFDIAINNAMVSFGSKAGHRSFALRSGLLRKFALSALFVCGLWIATPLIASFFKQNELIGPLRIALWIIPARSFALFIRTALQMTRRFFLDAIIDTVSSIFRLGALFGFLFTGMDIVSAALWASITCLVFPIFFVAPIIISLMQEKQQGIDHAKFTRYQLWMTSAFVSSAVASRLDIFFLTRYASLEIVGWYQAAFRLFMPIQQLAGSLSRVFAPRFASFRDNKQAQPYMKKGLLLCGLLGLSIFLLIPLFPWGIQLLYGQAYKPAISFSVALTFYFVLFLFATPFWSRLLYYRADARAYAVLSFVQLILLGSLFPFVIVSFGGVGAAIALFLTNIIVTTGAWRWSI